METFAGFAEHTDHEIGRLVKAIEDMGELDNTLFFYIVGDNGSSAEGGPDGTYNEMLALNGIVSDVASQLPHIDEWGGPTTFPHFSIGWAHAGNTPFQWTKQVASHFGGTRNPLVVHWPEADQGQGRGALAVPSRDRRRADRARGGRAAASRRSVNGTKQRPMDGVSMLYAFDDAKAKDRRTTQYFEMFGNRAIYHDGWVAATRHSIPWLTAAKLPAFNEDRWELYNVAEDFSQANDLAAKNPAEAEGAAGPCLTRRRSGTTCYPLDDRRSERFNAAIAGRPDLIGDRKSLTLYEGMTGITENAFINIKGRPHTDHRRDRSAARRRERRHHLPGRPLRRLEPVHEGRPRPRGLQLRRPRADHGLVARRRWRRAVTPSSTSSSRQRRSPATAARAG